MLTVRLLGPVAVAIDGAPPPSELLWRKHLAVCIQFWLSPERRRSRDQLVAMLWADKPERAARHSLNEALRVIRRAAGEGAVVSSGEDLHWHGEVDLDLDRFAPLAAVDPLGAAPLIGGELCEGFVVPDAAPFEDWLSAERRSWSARCVSVLASAAALADESGDSQAATELGARALRLDPFSDLAARAVIRSRWLLGDRGGAIATGQAFAARLASALGATPDPATSALLKEIGRSRRPVASPSIATPRRPPLIGRSEALGRLVDSWRGTLGSRQAALSVIEGEPGAGRTRLLEELLARAALDGATTLLLRAVDSDADVAEEGLLTLLHRPLLEAPGVIAAPSAALASLAARFPEWAERYPGVEGLTGLPLSAALAAVVRATAEDRPIVIAIDDADRLDQSSQRGIPPLVRALGAAPVLVVITLPRAATDDTADALRRIAGQDGSGTVVRLTPWGVDELADLVRRNLPQWSTEAQDRLARRLLVESAGLPGIAVEVLNAVEQGLALDPEAVSWPRPDHTLDQSLPAAMPSALVAALRMAFRRLDTESQVLLTTAALLPEPFAVAALQRLHDEGTEPALQARLDQLEWQCWLVADARGYGFRARAVRRMIAEEMLTPGQRQRIARRIEAL